QPQGRPRHHPRPLRHRHRAERRARVRRPRHGPRGDRVLFQRGGAGGVSSYPVRRVLLATVILFVAFPAGAQSKALAEAAFKEARRLVRQGKVAEACPKFEASLKLDPAPGTQLNLADCYARLGRTASAWAIFVEVAEKDTKAARAAEARRRAKALEPKLSRLTVSAENADGLRVTRDGDDITALLGVAVPVDPGRHVVAAMRGGDKWAAA